MRPDELSLEEQLIASTAIANFRKGQTQEKPMAEKIQFETNVSLTLALKYAEGKRVDSNYNEYEMYFSTVDGRCFYAAPMLAEKIAALNLSAREEFTICKKEIRVAGSKPRIEWQVSRPEQSSPTSTAPASTQNVPSGLSRPQNSNPPVKLPIDRAMTMFLLAAGRSTRTAEQILGVEGGSVRFDSRDVAAIATSMFIHAGREGWLTGIAPQTAQSSIAEQKINELQPKPPAAATTAQSVNIPEPWTTRGEMKRVFAELRGLVGDVKYFEVLAAAKVADFSQFRYSNDALACYNRLVSIVKAEAA